MTTTSQDYRLALQHIHQRSNYDRGYITTPRSGPAGLERGLARTRALLDRLGSPDRAYPIVHVAGSKGKGSTSAFVAAIGKAAGYRTGLSTSPHLHSFRERIAIDGTPVDESTFASLVFRCEAAIAALERDRSELGTVTAFELLTAMALLAFAEQSCELAVVEVGLGGTWDATNVVSPAVSVITRLDLEHTQILGDTIAEIATNKAGIIKSGVPVITAIQEPAAMDVIESIADRAGAPLLLEGDAFSAAGTWHSFRWQNAGRSISDLHTGMAGPHQMENAALAVAVWTQLAGRGLSASDDVIRTGLAATSLAGRFERVTAQGRKWILDGAHTPVAAAALAMEVLDEVGAPIPVIAGFLNDKHPVEFLRALAPAISELILTQPRNPRALDPVDLIPTVSAAISQITPSPNLETSLHIARARTAAETPIVITGSLVLIAEARELLGLAIPDYSPSEA